MNSLKKSFSIILAVFTIATFNGCKDEDGNKKTLNFFTLQDDKDFGAQVAAEIESDPTNYPILDSAKYPMAYQHLHRITDTILNSGKVQHKDDFVWQVKIIQDDSILNAFCTPGGYIYVYTGIIKFLNSEDELAGVMGHEIAHADERHSTEALTKQYGIDVLFSVLFGQDQGTLTQIAKGMIGLKYSRNNESEADMRSVDYLYPTQYDARGAARFFEAIIAMGGGGGPQFLSTHPNPENRVQAIMDYWEAKGGKVGERFESRYNDFKNSLPQ
ncbi:MAG: M48 family metalloprotease [Flavobacteriales bacterium]|nr:M48 family metalloprotease [Flavobacteriales bacterium]